jgi:hypothetical protein
MLTRRDEIMAMGDPAIDHRTINRPVRQRWQQGQEME